MTGTEWADSRRYVAPGTSPEPGPWRTSRVPYLAEPMNCSTDAETEIIVMMCSSQIAKSEFLLNVMGYYADQEPAPQLMVQPTVEGAEAFSKERIDPTFRYSPGLKGKLEDGKEGRGSSRKSSTTIRMKHYEGGYLALVGANSPAGLASRPIRILLADEVDRYGVTKEGDPLKLAIQRTTNFHNRKICLVSTPTIQDHSKIEEWWKKSDQRRYHVPCPHCGAGQVLKWSQVKWDRGPAGEHLPDSARYECEHCSEIMRGPGKPSPELLERGYWVKTNPESRIAGFHINSLYSPWVELSSLVAEFVEAKKNRDRKGLMEFVNLKLGEPWKEQQDEGLDEHLHRTHRHRYDGSVPRGALLLTAGVDVQDRYLVAEVVGWGIGRESWGVEYRMFLGDTTQDLVWNELDAFLQRTWETEDGRRLAIACAFIDSGGHRTDTVYAFAKAREYRRIYAIRGATAFGAPLLPSRPAQNRLGGWRFDLGVSEGKSQVLSRCRIDDEGPGYCHWPIEGESGYDLEYFRGLLGERLVYKYRSGRTVVEWEKVHERNEPLDVRVYATAAMEILNPDFERLAAAPAPVAAGPAQPPRKRRGTLSSGVRV